MNNTTITTKNPPKLFYFSIFIKLSVQSGLESLWSSSNKVKHFFEKKKLSINSFTEVYDIVVITEVSVGLTVLAHSSGSNKKKKKFQHKTYSI